MVIRIKDGRYTNCSPAESFLIFDHGVDSMENRNPIIADRWRVQRYEDIITLQDEVDRFNRKVRVN